MVLCEASQHFKTCTKCGKAQTKDGFYKKGKFLDSRCKKCVSTDKKATYLSKKDSDQGLFKDVVIMPFGSHIDGDVNDMVEALGAFLIEEFHSDQAINA